MSKTHRHNYPTSKKILAKILPFIVYFLQQLLLLTCRKKFLIPQKDIPQSAIWVAWHGQLIVLPPVYRKVNPVPKKISIIVSEHLDGDIAASLAKKYKMDSIRGSSRKGAIKALMQTIEALKKNEDVGITPDGPKGPLHSVSDGAVILAQKCNKPIIACGWSASSFWQLKSWDESRIPKPFSTITYKISVPIYIENIEKDEAKNIVKLAILQCMGEIKEFS